MNALLKWVKPRFRGGCCLVTGNDSFLVRSEIKRFQKFLETEKSLTVKKCSPPEYPLESLSAEMLNIDMFANKTVVFYRGIEDVTGQGKKSMQTLQSLLEISSPDTLIVFVDSLGKILSSKSVLKLFDAKKAVVNLQLTRSTLDALIEEEGLSVQPELLNRLISEIGISAEKIIPELEKIHLLEQSSDSPSPPKEIDAFITHYDEGNIFQVIEAIFLGSAEEFIKEFNLLVQTSSNLTGDIIGILTLCHQTARLLRFNSLLRESGTTRSGMTLDQFCEKAFKRPISPYRRKKILSQFGRVDSSWLIQLEEVLSRLETLVKTVPTAIKTTAVEKELLDQLLGAKGTPLSDGMLRS